eukprot:scaffold17774_cov17-Tisochrysis_lutea.AAC.1
MGAQPMVQRTGLQAAAYRVRNVTGAASVNVFRWGCIAKGAQPKLQHMGVQQYTHQAPTAQLPRKPWREQ